MKLQIGVCKNIITPEVGGRLYGYFDNLFSKAVRDDLTATAVVFSYGDLRYVVISATVAEIKVALSDSIRQKICEKTGIPFNHIMLCATHTHSGPNTCGAAGWGDNDTEYCDGIFAPKIIDAVEKASANLQEVEMGFSSGNSFVGINRRELNNHNQVILGQCPWGCFNPKMTVISFRNMQKEPVLNIVHYGCHGTAAGPNVEITRDWPGVMTDALEDLSGATTIFLNGPEGDVGPRLSNGATEGGGDVRFVDEMGEIAAKDVTRIYAGISSYQNVDMACVAGALELPLRKRMDKALAEKLLAAHNGNMDNIDGLIYQFYKNTIASYENGYVERAYKSVDQSILRLGEIVFASFPYELFSEMGMRIEKMSKYDNVLSLALTNGLDMETGAYFPTQEQYVRGGYEVAYATYSNVQTLREDADWSLIQGTLKNIDKL